MLQNVETVTGQELIKSLEECGVNLTEDEKNSILLKAKEQEDKESAEETKEDNGEGGEGQEEDEDLEKACSKMKSEYADMEKSMADKKKAIEEMEAKMKPVKKSVEEDLSKSEGQDELIKSLRDEISSIKSIKDVLEKSLGEVNENFKSEIAEIKKSIEEIGSQRIGQRSIKNVNFIEKGGYVQDETGKKVLSVSSNKEAVLDVLEKAMDKCTDIDLKKGYEQTILGYNMGGADISKSIADDLFASHNVRLVK